MQLTSKFAALIALALASMISPPTLRSIVLRADRDVDACGMPSGPNSENLLAYPEQAWCP